ELRRRPGARGSRGLQGLHGRRSRRERPLRVLRGRQASRRAPRHRGGAVGSGRPQGQAVPHDPRSLAGLGRQGPGAALPRPEHAVSMRFTATYLIETPLDVAQVAEVLAGEQSCGTFARVEGETEALRERARATVEKIELLDVAETPALPN